MSLGQGDGNPWRGPQKTYHLRSESADVGGRWLGNEHFESFPLFRNSDLLALICL